MISVRASDMPGLRERLLRHPRVSLLPGDSVAPIEFEGRRVTVGESAGLRGLVELCDNNPMVCSDSFSVPDAGATLAMIAVGPLIRAGVLVEAPTLTYSFEPSPDGILDHFAVEGWRDGATLVSDSSVEGDVLAVVAMAVVRTESVEALAELDEIYEEAFGRSFCVGRDENSDWDSRLVLGQPYAVYRLRITPDTPYSLLTIQAMADAHGKCGAAQVVHAMNVMAGFEESLGF